MSRGLGRTERVVLGYLKTRPPDWPVRLTLIADVTKVHPESVRRAMKTLAAKGVVELGRDNGWRLFDDGLFQMYETTCPTAKLSADYLSALSGNGS